MSNPRWSKASLNSLCSRIGDGIHGTPQYVENSEYFFINGNNLKQGSILTSLETKKVSRTEFEKYFIKFDENTLFLSINGTLGSLAKYRGESVILGKSAAYIKCSNINIDFLYYYLQLEGVQQQMWNVATGSTIKNLSLDSIRNLQIPTPLDLEQQKIAAVLSVLDAKIDCNNRINAELEAMAKTLYDYWFVQFDFPYDFAQGRPAPNGKPYRTAGGKMVYNPTLKREIPEGWEFGALSEWIARDKTGDWGKESCEGNYTLQVDCIRGTDINGLIGTGGIEAPTRFILEKNSSKILLPFDFVIEISGGSPTQSTGRMAFILPETINRFANPLICSNFCKAMSLKDKTYFFNFVYEWQSAYDNKILFGWEGKTSGIKNLLFDAFVSKYIVCKPPLNLAQKFFEFVIPLQIKKQKLLRENDELEALRDWLLPMLMNGQVTVT
ncbi:MAG: restriction endonuclease subunit S [Gallionella sp.]|nr:restriction endonuclease subunit S [Gallionella sp.]MDD4958708.1 restriction endonuclease subunit S [Gallionella sp.]